jgi:hypothetical protein
VAGRRCKRGAKLKYEHWTNWEIKQNKGVANIYAGMRVVQKKKLCFNLISNFRPEFYEEEEKKSKLIMKLNMHVQKQGQ